MKEVEVCLNGQDWIPVKVSYKSCEICGKSLKSLGNHIAKKHRDEITIKEYYDKYIRQENEGICPVCSKETTFRGLSKGYLRFCCLSCAMKSEEIQTKVTSTMTKRYGVKWAAQNSEIRQKQLSTTKDRYGAEYLFQIEEIRNKAIKSAHTEEANIKRVVSRKKTIDEKYNGVEIFLQPQIYNKVHSAEADKKRKNTMKSKSSTEKYNSHKKRMETIYKNIAQFEHENNCILKSKIIAMYGQGWLHEWDKIEKIYSRQHTYILKSSLPLIIEYANNPHKFYNKDTSRPEKEVLEYIKSIYSGNIIKNTRKVIHPYEVDIYIPDKRLAIEFNGVYWHSVNFGKDKNYHLIKSNLCREKNIRLIHIFEDEWDLKQDICKSIILSALGIYDKKIYARQCEIKEVSNKEARQFLEENHLQGYVPSSYRLGLYYQNELVQLITIGKSRFKKGEIELLRMCSKLNTQVIGGFSKLLKHQPYNELISYIDRAKFNGLGYFSVEFILLLETPPSYFYWRNDTGRINRYSAQKHKLNYLLGIDKIDNNLTENEIMLSNKFFKLYDCGNFKVRYAK